MCDSTLHSRPALRNAVPTLSAPDCHARKSAIYPGETTVPLHLLAVPSRDSCGLHDHIARWYDPTVGCWLSEDPIGFLAGDENLYRYVGNEATNLIDANGLLHMKSFGQGARVSPVTPDGKGFVMFWRGLGVYPDPADIEALAEVKKQLPSL